MWIKLQDIDFSPSRNLGYSSFFQAKNGDTICCDCLEQNQKNQKEYLQDSDQEVVEDAQEKMNQEFFEFANPQSFNHYCYNCNEAIECDWEPSNVLELVEFLIYDGWDLNSAYDFALDHLDAKDLSNADGIIPDDLIDYLNDEYKEWEIISIEDGWVEILADDLSLDFNLEPHFK